MICVDVPIYIYIYIYIHIADIQIKVRAIIYLCIHISVYLYVTRLCYTHYKKHTLQKTNIYIYDIERLMGFTGDVI